MVSNQEKKSLLIIDGYGFIFRAYHVQPPLTSPQGEPVGALYGFTSMLLKILSDFRPNHAVIVLDYGGKNFRHKIFKDYKANRPLLTDDLISQLRLVRAAAEALNFSIYEKEGFEADDIIATLAKRATEIEEEATIISSDKDLMQLINGHIKMYDPAKSKYISSEDVFLKFGVTPDKVREVQALIGDSSDNIPGVRGIGPKTAAELINKFGNLELLLNSIKEINNPRQQQMLIQNRENALMSWQLVGLDQKVEVDLDLNNLGWQAPDHEKIFSFLNKYGFKSLHKRVENLFNLDAHKNNIPAAIDLKNNKDRKLLRNLIQQDIKTLNEFNHFHAHAEKIGVVGINLVKIENISKIVFSVENIIYLIDYFPRSQLIGKNTDLFSFAAKDEINNNFNNDIEKILSDPSIKKITYDLKALLKYVDCEINSCDDLQLMDYCATASSKNRTIIELMSYYISVEIEGEFVNKNIDSTAYFIDCYHTIEEELLANKLWHLYKEIDLPLCNILHQMEEDGVKIDTNYLAKLSNEFSREISTLEKNIFSLTGQEFNISSPKQLGEILFDKMKLPFGKMSGKSKSYSTDSKILEKLAEENFEIASMLLKYRHLSKLKNTYTETLPKQIDSPLSSRVHTTFLQTSTSTGRLSSQEPNVQNIPIRTPEGNSIRAAFIAADGGYKLISADYSQIELRILSHVADIPALQEAFARNLDIHTQTAAQIFGITHEEVTPDLRRNAKAINFGIIYGISAFGLTRQLNISKKQAVEYIDRYFKEYPGIQDYMARTIEFAKKHGYVENLLGRKCFVPTINSKDHNLRTFAERAAINAPMQSLAADIVKIAMIKLDKELKLQQFRTKSILQIHDELIFEAPQEEVEAVKKIIKSTMEQAYILKVPMKVDIGSGNNWQEIH